MARSVTPFLMFEGTAEEAMNFYVVLLAARLAVGAVPRASERADPTVPGSR